MARCDKVTAAIVCVLMLIVAPLMIGWELYHPESRRPGPGNDPCVYLPVVAVAYALMARAFAEAFRYHRRMARRKRIKDLIAQTEDLIRQGRREEARAAIALAQKLSNENRPW